MSSSYVKQSLSLFEDDLNNELQGVKKKKSTDPMKLISTKKKGVKKELKKLQNQQKRKTLKNRKKSVSIKESSRYQLDDDLTEASVKALQRLEKVKATDPGMSTLISEHHHKNVSRSRNKDIETDVPAAPETLFTEDDFKKFNEEFDFK